MILLQAIRRILPPLTSQAIIAKTLLTFELWFTVAGMYLMVTVTLSLFVAYLEHRFKITR